LIHAVNQLVCEIKLATITARRQYRFCYAAVTARGTEMRTRGTRVHRWSHIVLYLVAEQFDDTSGSLRCIALGERDQLSLSLIYALMNESESVSHELKQ
jgi:hypothetical protein